MRITVANSTFKFKKAFLSIPYGSKVPDIAIYDSFISGETGFEERDKPTAGSVTQFSCRRIIVDR